MRSVNGWTIVHIAAIEWLESNGVTTKVRLESQDARINGVDFTAVNSLQMARVGWTYALRFRQGSIIDARILQEG